LKPYQPNDLSHEEQTDIKIAMEAAQVSADRQQTPFVVMKSLAIFEMTTHNQGEAVEIVQPRERKFYASFSR
jgi:hypothetical protein